MLRRVFVTAMLLGVLGMVGHVHAQEIGDSWLVYRSGGFRPPGFATPRSDFRFQVTPEGKFSYESFVSNNDKRYVRSGALPFSVEEFSQRLTEIGFDELMPPDPNEPQIADRPEMRIQKPGGFEGVAEVTLGLEKPLATKLDLLISEIVMGIVPIDLTANPLSDEVEFGQPLEPLLVTDMETLESKFSPLSDSLKESIDFEKQQVVIFRWRGSGQDELFSFREGDGEKEQVTIVVRRGMTRDLREHQYAMAIPKGIDWKVVAAPSPRMPR